MLIKFTFKVWSKILLCVHTVDDGKVFWGLIVRGRGRVSGHFIIRLFMQVYRLHLHYTHQSTQHTLTSPEGRIMMASGRKMTKTLSVQLSQIILIPCSCSEQSFCVQFLWGCKGGERVSLPSCLQSVLPLSPSYSKEGGELSKNSPHCHIFL